VGFGRRLREVAPVWILLLAALVTGCAGSSETRTATTQTSAGQATGTDQYTGTDPESGLQWVSRSELPPEARDTLDEIAAGPPYRYDRDGIMFENREGLLPEQELGYYEEFTVETPGSSDRGARRIIWGLQDELYYTDDHYQSFERITP
jgi:ribonuclease T1